MWLVPILLAPALAQETPAPSAAMNAQLYRPPVDSQATLWTEDTHAAPDGYATARAFLQYANAPLRTRVDGELEPVVRDVAELDLVGAYTFRSLRLGFHAPLYLYTAGPFDPNQPGLGDMALDLKATLIDREEAPLGLALMGRLLLPTSSVEVPLGSRGLGWELVAMADRRFGDLLVAANLGTRDVPRATFEEMVWNDAVFLRTGAGYALRDDLGVSADLSLQTNWASGHNPAGTAAELMGGGWATVAPDWVIRGGVSAGLSRSPGAPRARLVAGLSFEPDPYPDRDLDGIVDRSDWCPLEAEDVDGVEDADGCLDPVVTVRLDLRDPSGAPVREGTLSLVGPETHELALSERLVTLHPGTYALTVTAPGHEPLREEITLDGRPGASLERTLVAQRGTIGVWAVDVRGAPVDAAWTVSGEGPHAADGSPVEVGSGEHALVVQAPGYLAEVVSLHVEHGEAREYAAVLRRADDPQARVRLRTDRIEIDTRFFDAGRDALRPESLSALDEVAALLLAHPEIRTVALAAPSEAGSASGDLAARRAEALRSYLVDQGVQPSRLRVETGAAERVELRILDAT